MHNQGDFKILTFKSDEALKNLKPKPSTPESYPYSFPYTYILVCKTQKHLIKVGRSRQPYHRLCEFNQHTRKYLNGLEFKMALIIDSPIYFENQLKRSLKGCEFQVNSKIDGSTEVYDLRCNKWKTPLTIVKNGCLGNYSYKQLTRHSNGQITVGFRSCLTYFSQLSFAA